MNRINERLFLCVQGGDIDGANKCIASGASINAKNALKKTVTHIAAEKGDIEMINFLAKNGANPNARCALNITPLEATVGKRNIEAANALLAAGADPSICGEQMIYHVAHAGDIEMLSYALSIGARCHNKIPVLALVMHSASESMIDLLIQAGSDINIADHHSNTPIIAAVRARNHEAVRCLLRHGCDIRHKDKQHKDAFYYAIESMDSEFISLLLDHINTHNGDTYNFHDNMIVSVMRNNFDVLDYTLNLPVDVHARGPRKENIAHVSALYGDINMIRKVSSLGVDMNIKNRYGETPIELAIRRGDFDILKTLCECGANPDHLRIKHPDIHAKLRPIIDAQRLKNSAIRARKTSSNNAGLGL